MTRRRILVPTLVALALLASSGVVPAQPIDTDALVNDRALAEMVFYRAATAGDIADAMEKGDEKASTLLQLGAVMQREAFAPETPVEVRLIERLRELELPEGHGQTAIWRVCRYPDRSCASEAVMLLDETAYLADRPAHFAED